MDNLRTWNTRFLFYSLFWMELRFFVGFFFFFELDFKRQGEANNFFANFHGHLETEV